MVRRRTTNGSLAAGPFALRDRLTGETLVLVTLIGLDAAKSGRMIDTLGSRLAHFDRVVFVLTSHDLVEATRHGAVVEQLPGGLETATASHAETRYYVQARYDQMVRKWHPDYILHYGATVQAYCDSILLTHTSEATNVF